MIFGVLLNILVLILYIDATYEMIIADDGLTSGIIPFLVAPICLFLFILKMVLFRKEFVSNKLMLILDVLIFLLPSLLGILWMYFWLGEDRILITLILIVVLVAMGYQAYLYKKLTNIQG